MSTPRWRIITMVAMSGLPTALPYPVKDGAVRRARVRREKTQKKQPRNQPQNHPDIGGWEQWIHTCRTTLPGLTAPVLSLITLFRKTWIFVLSAFSKNRLFQYAKKQFLFLPIFSRSHPLIHTCSTLTLVRWCTILISLRVLLRNE